MAALAEAGRGPRPGGRLAGGYHAAFLAGAVLAALAALLGARMLRPACPGPGDPPVTGAPVDEPTRRPGRRAAGAST